MRLKAKSRWSEKMENKLLHFWLHTKLPAHRIAQRISFECGLKRPLTKCAVVSKANRLTKGRELSYAERRKAIL
jgi:hypothetical protein